MQSFACTHGGGKAEGGKVPDEAITPKSEDYSKWYLDIVAKAQLADYGPAAELQGCAGTCATLCCAYMS
eukprot:1162142-Pelagomonas_calceolata.AAC.6